MKKRSNRIIAMLLVFLLLTTTLPFSAMAATIDEAPQSVGASSGTTGECNWSLQNGVLTISGNGATADYDTALNKTPWGYNIKKVIIESGVTAIGRSAFSGCHSLTEVQIAPTVVSIGIEAFMNCDQLTSIALPDSVTEIKDDAFRKCSSLSAITLSPFTRYVSDSAFTDTAWLKSQPDGLVISGTTLYCVKGTLTGDVTVPDGINCIACFAFSEQSRITSVTLPESVKYINSSAFNRCSSMQTITLPRHVEEMGVSVFQRSGIREVELPDDLPSITNHMFSGCTQLRKITLPETVTSLEYDAFADCTALSVIENTDQLLYVNGTALNRTPWYGAKANGAVYVGSTLYRYKGACPETVTVADGTAYIADYAFSQCTTLKHIDLPDSIKGIGTSAFAQSGLTEIAIPENCQKLDAGVFSSCAQLKKAIINGVSTWGTNVFGSCGALRDVTINRSVSSIGNSAFFECGALRHVTIEQGVKTIEPYAFTGCEKLSYVQLPESLTSIGTRAFFNCDSLKKLVIPRSVSELGDDPFGTKNDDAYHIIYVDDFTVWLYSGSPVMGKAKRFAKNYVILDSEPDEAALVAANREALAKRIEALERDMIVGVVWTRESAEEYIDAMAYAKQTAENPNACADLLAVALTELNAAYEGLTVFEGDFTAFDPLIDKLKAFLDTDEAKLREDYAELNAVLSDAIGTRHCADCQEDIDNAVTELTALLEALGVPVTAPVTSGVTGDCEWTLDDGVLTISGEGVTASYGYYDTLPWGTDIRKVIVQDGVTKIGDYAFLRCGKLEEVVLANSVTAIGDWSFSDCDKLESFTTGSGLESIGHGAFYQCAALGNIEFPDSLKTLGQHTFYNCGAMTAVELPDGMTELASSAFLNCTALRSVKLPDQLEKLGLSAFCDCKALESIVLPDTLTYLGNYAFMNCQSLRSIVIPDKVDKILAQTFENCTSLTDIHLGSGVKEINKGVFRGCTSLQTITLSDETTTIDGSVFENCTALTSVTVYKKINKIDESAFVGCKDLTLYGFADTKAQTFAEEQAIAFHPLNQKGTPVTLGDVNADGVVNILDATELQRLLAEYCTVNTAILANAIEHFSGTVNINDVTVIQRRLMQN